MDFSLYHSFSLMIDNYHVISSAKKIHMIFLSPELYDSELFYVNTTKFPQFRFSYFFIMLYIFVNLILVFIIFL